MVRHGPMRVLPLRRMSLLFEAVFEQLEVDLGAVARDPKVVGQAAVVAAIEIEAHHQQSQKCKTGCDGGPHNFRLLDESHHVTRIWRQR